MKLFWKWASGNGSFSVASGIFHRWDGAAHVAISVEVMGTGVVTPAVKRLNFFANVRVGLNKMVPYMPGFGAMLISFQSPPLVTFDLDCGPGLGEVIEAWLIPFLKNDLLGNMLVWPNRIVLKLLPPDKLGPCETLYLHTRGVLKVTAIEARGLPKADLIGKGDPFAVFETVAFKPAKTKVQHPQFHQTLHLVSGVIQHRQAAVERNHVLESAGGGSDSQSDRSRSRKQDRGRSDDEYV